MGESANFNSKSRHLGAASDVCVFKIFINRLKPVTMKTKYENPEIQFMEIRIERGFAASSWDDSDQGTYDVWIDKGETDDEWA